MDGTGHLAHNPAMKSPHDAYIAKAPEFAQPILEKIRKAFRKACPDVVESLKWSSPAFEHHGILGGMAAFKKHVSLSFWRATEMEDPEGILDRAGNALMGIARFWNLRPIPARAISASDICNRFMLPPNQHSP